jgi:hypothetical protein
MSDTKNTDAMAPKSDPTLTFMRYLLKLERAERLSWSFYSRGSYQKRCVNLRDVAAVGAHAPPLAEGSRIKMVLSGAYVDAYGQLDRRPLLMATKATLFMRRGTRSSRTAY